MAKKIQVEVDVNTSPAEDKLEGLGAAIRRAKKELRNLPEGSQEWKNKFNEIDDLQDKLKASEAASKDLFDTLESAPGPLGALGSALNKAKVATQSFGAAFKAIGIGLIVSAIAGLVAAFSETEGAAKKLEPLMIGFQKILGGIFEALTPLIDAFIELATDALPYVTKGVSVFYSSLVALFTLVKEGGVGIGKILKGIFTLDTKVIEEGWAQLTGSWDKTVEAFNDTSERFNEGTKKRTKIEKQNAEDSEKIRKEALDKKLKELEQLEKLDEARLNKEKELALALAQTEKEKLDVEVAFAQKRYDLQKAELDKKLKLLDPKKDIEEYRNTQIALAELDANRLKEVNGFNEQKKKIAEDELKAQKDFEEKSKEIRDAAIKDEVQKAIAQRQAKYEKELSDLEADKQFIKKSEEEKNELRKALAQGLENDLDKIRTDAKVKELDSKLKLDEARLKVLQEGSTEYFNQQRQIENDAYEQQKLAAKGNADQLEAIELQHKANLKNIDKAEFEAKKDLQAQIANLYGGFGKALQEIAGKNKGLAIAGLLIEQAAGVASIIINTQKAAAKAGYFTPLGIATLIAGAASVAAAIAATVKGIQQINSVDASGSKSAGSGNSQSPAPTYSGGPTAMTAPQIQSAPEATPGQQIAQTLSQTQNRPIRAYVISGEVSSQQALDRRSNRGATFNLG